jgi:hypothetical protein
LKKVEVVICPNGHAITRPLKIKMGVKQRGLLTPYLFILVGNTKFYGQRSSQNERH